MSVTSPAALVLLHRVVNSRPISDCTPVNDLLPAALLAAKCDSLMQIGTVPIILMML